MNRIEKAIEDCKELQKDCEVIKDVAKKLGYSISSLHAERLWSEFSEELSAHWLSTEGYFDIEKVLLSETDEEGCRFTTGSDYMAPALIQDYSLLREFENLILTHQTNLDGTKRYACDPINDELLGVLQSISFAYKKKLGLVRWQNYSLPS